MVRNLPPFAAAGLLMAGSPVLAEDAAPLLDEVSVTATREARVTRDVPQSISVVGKEKIDDAKMFNVKDAIQGIPGVLIESNNGGYDSRLIIRGAGLKATYGVREIMVLRDGVPLTDPDSMTRFDWIDTQDIERIEVAKGPGNLYSPGAAGGAIQIISRSVFDQSANRLQLGAGNYGADSEHLRYGTMLNDSNAVAVTLSRRKLDSDWRRWNRFDTEQAGIKHGLQLDNGATLESELAYTEANLQLPGSMSAAQFEDFKRSGRQTATQDPWKNSGRYSTIWFVNSKYEQNLGDWVLKPRVYYNQWRHYHPVTGIINDSKDWTRNLGTDLEAQNHHSLGSLPGTLIMGVSLRRVANDDARKYQYRDVVASGGRITATLSDAEGALAETQNYKNDMAGIYLQESVHLTPRALLDVGFRFDRSRLDISGNQITTFDYSSGRYVRGSGLYAIDKVFHLPAPKVGISYRVSESVSAYASAARAAQVPADSEVSNNPNLNPATSANVEFGFKGRAAGWSFDTAIYRNSVTDEIVTVRNPSGINDYVNAGKTEKKGFEFSGSREVARGVEAGLNYAYSDYKFISFSEPVRVGATTTNVSRDGNQLPYVPRHQYGVFGLWRIDAAWHLRAAANSWGRYYLDNANSDSYGGYRWVTNLTLAYEQGHHAFAVKAENLFDQHYASQVTKDTSGKLAYTAAAPRSVLATYTYRF